MINKYLKNCLIKSIVAVFFLLVYQNSFLALDEKNINKSKTSNVLKASKVATGIILGLGIASVCYRYIENKKISGINNDFCFTVFKQELYVKKLGMSILAGVAGGSFSAKIVELLLNKKNNVNNKENKSKTELSVPLAAKK